MSRRSAADSERDRQARLERFAVAALPIALNALRIRCAPGETFTQDRLASAAFDIAEAMERELKRRAR